MKKILIITTIFMVGIIIFVFNKNSNKELVKVEEIKTDTKFVNVTYDKVEDIWDDSVLGILTIEKIGLNAIVKEGT